MTRLYVKPAPARSVPVPAKGGQLLGEQGEFVPRDAYWQRRLNDKDVIEAEPPVAAKAKNGSDA